MFISRLIILTFINLITNPALPFYTLAMDEENLMSIEDQDSAPNEGMDIELNKKRSRDPSASRGKQSDPSKKRLKINSTEDQNSAPNGKMDIENETIDPKLLQQNLNLKLPKKNMGTFKEVPSADSKPFPAGSKFQASIKPAQKKFVLKPSAFSNAETNPFPQEIIEKKKEEKEKKEKKKNPPERENNEKSVVSLIKMEGIPNQKPIFTPKSSEWGRTMGKFIIDEVVRAKKQIVIGCEQLTDDKLVNALIEKKKLIPLNILVGNNPEGLGAEEKLNKDSQICTAILSSRNNELSKRNEESNCIQATNNKKMHNKFIIIDDKVFVGSPNATTTAFKNNVESLIFIQDFELANLYALYFEYIIKTAHLNENRSLFSTIEPADTEIRHAINDYNTNKKGDIKVCLGPVNNIIDFIKKSCAGVAEIKINMFLVSYSNENDIIDFLIEKSKNTKVILNIDDGQYISQDFVQEAIKHIEKNIKTKGQEENFQIHRIKMRYPRASFHDKLILIKKGNEKYVLIGSAGWTKDVQENKNYESMIQIKDDKTYDYFNKHFNYFIPGSEKISEKVGEIWKARFAPSLAPMRGEAIIRGVRWTQEYPRR